MKCKGIYNMGSRAGSVPSRAGAGMIFLMLFITALFSGACHNNEQWDSMPADISDFVSEYYPGSGIDSYTHSDDIYHVRVKDGPGMTFDASYKWIAIDGYGLPLPQVMLFDQLPPKLYSYLEDTDQLNSVFSMERDSKRYTVTLQYSTLTYDINSGEISGTAPTS